MTYIEWCRCQCHEGPQDSITAGAGKGAAVSHPYVACCQTCPHCGRGVKEGFEAHRETCPSKPVSDTSEPVAGDRPT